jgi:hypothetical protein
VHWSVCTQANLPPGCGEERDPAFAKVAPWTAPGPPQCTAAERKPNSTGTQPRRSGRCGGAGVQRRGRGVVADHTAPCPPLLRGLLLPHAPAALLALRDRRWRDRGREVGRPSPRARRARAAAPDAPPGGAACASTRLSCAAARRRWPTPTSRSCTRRRTRSRTRALAPGRLPWRAVPLGCIHECSQPASCRLLWRSRRPLLSHARARPGQVHETESEELTVFETTFQRMGRIPFIGSSFHEVAPGHTSTPFGYLITSSCHMLVLPSHMRRYCKAPRASHPQKTPGMSAGQRPGPRPPAVARRAALRVLRAGRCGAGSPSADCGVLPRCAVGHHLLPLLPAPRPPARQPCRGRARR